MLLQYYREAWRRPGRAQFLPGGRSASPHSIRIAPPVARIHPRFPMVIAGSEYMPLRIDTSAPGPYVSTASTTVLWGRKSEPSSRHVTPLSSRDPAAGEDGMQRAQGTEGGTDQVLTRRRRSTKSRS